MITAITKFLNRWGTLGRWVLSVLLVYGVYTETGKWTMIAMALIFSGSELEVIRRRKQQASLDKLLDLIERIGKR